MCQEIIMMISQKKQTNKYKEKFIILQSIGIVVTIAHHLLQNYSLQFAIAIKPTQFFVVVAAVCCLLLAASIRQQQQQSMVATVACSSVSP